MTRKGGRDGGKTLQSTSLCYGQLPQPSRQNRVQFNTEKTVCSTNLNFRLWPIFFSYITLYFLLIQTYVDQRMVLFFTLTFGSVYSFPVLKIFHSFCGNRLQTFFFLFWQKGFRLEITMFCSPTSHNGFTFIVESRFRPRICSLTQQWEQLKL